MPEIYEFDRNAAVKYAKIWAYSRNPLYYDFSRLGGDCTNYASQCILEGCNVMNYTPVMGWYYKNAYERTASWTGVEFLYNFLTSNSAEGPFAQQTNKYGAEIGDIVQLGTINGAFYHSPIIVDISAGEIFVAAHSYDVYGKPLSEFTFDRVRFIHIIGYRK